jgi:hypothetical protein
VGRITGDKSRVFEGSGELLLPDGSVAADCVGKYIKMDIPQGKSMTSTYIFPDIVETDVLINVPIAKNHSAAVLTLGAKNLMGIVKDRNMMHADLHQRIADLTSLVMPDLTVVDAVRILTAHGPTGGDLADVKQTDTIIASRDIVAADAYATTLFGMTGADIGYIKASADMGLGTMDLSSIDIQEINLGWAGSWRHRQAVQILFFTLYIYKSSLWWQQIARRYQISSSFEPAFSRGSSSSRQWIPNLGLAFVTVGLTLIIGRVWCGWICPMGSLLDWISFKKARKRAASISPRWRLVKYFLLAVTLALALFGGLTLLVFDPIAIFTRTLTTAVLPAIFYAVNALEMILYKVNFLSPALDTLDGLMRGGFLPVEQPAYAQNIAIADYSSA